MGNQNAQKSWRVMIIAASAFGAGAALAWAGLPGLVPDRSKSPFATAPGERAIGDVAELLVSLESPDLEVRSKARQDLGSIQRTICDRLEVILNREKPQNELGDARQFAADLLKNCYSAEATALLVQHIDYRGIGMVSTELSPFNGYPCAMTLNHYRHEAVAAILRHLAQTPADKISPTANELYAWLFVEAYARGRRLEPGSDATFLIERAKSMAVGEERKNNYDRLLDTIKELTKNWPD